MTGAVSAANPTVRFGLELCMLAVLALWGAQASGSPVLRVALGVASPLLAAVVWGAWIAPKAARRLRDPARFALELVVWAAATAALTASGHPLLAVALALAAVVTAALVRV